MVWEADDSSYIEDAMDEAAERYVSPYYGDLCKSCFDLYSNDVFEELDGSGLIDGANNDILKILEIAQFEYYRMLLYSNVAALCQNIVLKGFERDGIAVDAAQWESIKNNVLTDIDTSMTFDDLYNQALAYIE